MSWLRKSWIKNQAKALKVVFFLLFAAGFLIFLISACGKKKPTEQKVNNRPELLALTNRSIQENQTVSFALISFDVDGTVPKLSVVGAPKNAIFVDSLNGRGSFSWTATFSQEGSYFVRFIASDGALADTEKAVIMVGNVNRSPVWQTISDQFFTEEITRNFSVRAIDPDGDSIFLSTDSLPVGAIFTDSSSGKGSFVWLPTFAQSGTYFVFLIASDGFLADTERVNIFVGNVNRQPELLPVDSQSFVEGVAGSFAVSASDPDGDSVFLSADSLPVGAAFNDSLNSRGSFSWTPDFTQSGSYRPLFVATDRNLADSQAVNVRVLEFDRPPEFAFTPNQQITEGQLLAFSVSASDPDGTTARFTAMGLPSGATFVDSVNGRGGFRWLTKVLQAGTYNIIFLARSGALTDTAIISVRVDTALITYTAHTKPIFDSRCASCHYPGGSECPSICFSTYAEARQLKDRIRIRVVAGTMPPGGGLPQGKRDTINAWVLRGAPQ